MKKIFLKLFLFFILSILSGVSDAQVNDALSNRRFKKIQQPPGIKIDFDNILISKMGGIWASSKNDGLVYYDGTEMKIYRHSRTDTNTIAAGWIYDISEDPEGNLYVAVYDGGLNIINKKRNSIEKITFKDSIQESKSALLMSICADEQHNVLIGLFGRGLLVYNTINKSIRHFNLDPSKPDNWFLPFGNTINGIKQDPSDNNIFWIMSSKGGLYNYDRSTSEVHAVYAAPDTSRKITRAISLFVNKKGDVFFGSGNNSINIFNKKNGQIKFGTEMSAHTGFRTTSRVSTRGAFYNRSDAEFYHFFSTTEVVTYTPTSDTYRSYKLPSIGLHDLSHV